MGWLAKQTCAAHSDLRPQMTNRHRCLIHITFHWKIIDYGRNEVDGPLGVAEIKELAGAAVGTIDEIKELAGAAVGAVDDINLLRNLQELWSARHNRIL